MLDKVRAWEAKMLRPTIRPRMNPDETWVGHTKRIAQPTVANELEKDWEDNQRRGDGEGAGQTGERQRQCEKGWYCDERSIFLRP